MEPIKLTIGVFGVVMGLSAFVRQLLLSRDKRINEEARRRALGLQPIKSETLRVESVVTQGSLSQGDQAEHIRAEIDRRKNVLAYQKSFSSCDESSSESPQSAKATVADVMQ